MYRNGDGEHEARSVGNLAKGFELPSVIRAYDSPNFVVNRGMYLPYSPDHLAITGTLDRVNGKVTYANGDAVSNGSH